MPRRSGDYEQYIPPQPTSLPTLTLLYWQIGHDILELQGLWAEVIKQLAHDLQVAFPK